MTRFVPLVAYIALSSVPVRAEVKLCDGVWKSGSCERIPVASSTAPGGGAREKELIVLQLQSFAEQVRGEFGAPGFEAQGVHDFCREPSVSLADCRARALQAERNLITLVRDFSRMRQRDQKLRQQEESLAMRRQKLLHDARGRPARKR